METNSQIDRVLKKSNENPPVHPHLIEHLREKFSLSLPKNGQPTGESSLAWLSRASGQSEVIDYLETLINQGDNPDEPFSTESESPDPRRPGTRARG